MKFFQGVVLSTMMGSGLAGYEKFVSKHKARAVEVSGGVFNDKCARACYNTKKCRYARHSQGSYCKPTEDGFGVCFGLYYKYPPTLENDGGDQKRAKYCYEPNDLNCPEVYPLKCRVFPEAEMKGSTPEAAAETVIDKPDVVEEVALESAGDVMPAKEAENVDVDKSKDGEDKKPKDKKEEKVEKKEHKAEKKEKTEKTEKTEKNEKNEKNDKKEKSEEKEKKTKDEKPKSDSKSSKAKTEAAPEVDGTVTEAVAVTSDGSAPAETKEATDCQAADSKSAPGKSEKACKTDKKTKKV